MVFVNAGHELRNVSGHFSVITEMKRENPAKYLFYGILLWKLPSVEQLSEEEVSVGVQSIFPGHNSVRSPSSQTCKRIMRSSKKGYCKRKIELKRNVHG